MPVLMNKGDNPRQAAWLFYTDRETLDALGRTAAEQRFDAGVLTVDAADLDGAPKASSVVPVYLAVATLVPEDFDLEGFRAAAGEDKGDEGDAENAEEQPAGEKPADGEQANEDETPAEAGEADGTSDSDADSDADGADELPYEPIPAPEGTRILIGSTTAAAARAFIQPREVDGEPWAAELPGLQMLVSLIDYMREHGGLPTFAVWHVDPQGILRMAPAKQVKPMAGNVLKCKL